MRSHHAWAPHSSLCARSVHDCSEYVPRSNPAGPNPSRPERVVRVSEIGQYIQLQSCPRRFRLEVNRRREARKLPFAERLFNTLDPVLQEIGGDREDVWEASLQSAGLRDLTRHSQRGANDPAATWFDLCAAVAGLAAGDQAYGREVWVEAVVGGWRAAQCCVSTSAPRSKHHCSH